MSRLPLDDRRWSELEYRNGRGTYIAQRLKALLEEPGDVEAFKDLWPHMCSEGTAWSAAYAAAPYVIDIAAALPPDRRLEHVFFVGLVEWTGGLSDCPSYLKAGYKQARGDALKLASEVVLSPHDLTDTRYLLAAVAALKGHRRLGELLSNLDAGCPHCGEDLLFTDDLK